MADPDPPRSSVTDVLSKFLTPAAWIASIVAFIGLAGLVFNTLLSLFVGAHVATYTSTGEHFGAGASLLLPGIVYTADLTVAVLYIIFVLLLLWFAFVLVIRIAFAVAYGVLLLLVRLVRRQQRGAVQAAREASLQSAANKLAEESPLVWSWTMGMPTMVGRTLRWTRGSLTWVFTFAFLLLAAALLTLWVPYVEASRYRTELCQAAELSLTAAGSRSGISRCDLTTGRPGAPAVPADPTDLARAAGLASSDDAGSGADAGEESRPQGIVCRFIGGQDPATHQRGFSGPALRLLSLEDGGWVGDSALGATFGWGARQLNCGVQWVQAAIPIGSLLAKPKLVAIALKDAGVLRPMLSVAEYGEVVILYDFLFDAQYGDEFLFPLRVLKRNDIRHVSAVDPAGQMLDSDLPILSVLNTACGRNPVADLEDREEDADAVKALKLQIRDQCSFKKIDDTQDCIKKQFIESDALVCRASQLPRTAEADKTDNLSVALQTIASLSASLAERQDVPDDDGVGADAASVLDSIKSTLERLAASEEQHSEQLHTSIGGVADGVARTQEQVSELMKFAEASSDLATRLIRIEGMVTDLRADVGRHDARLAGLNLDRIAPILDAFSRDLASAKLQLAESLSGGKVEITTVLTEVRSQLQVLSEKADKLAVEIPASMATREGLEAVLREIAALDLKLDRAHEIFEAAVKNGVSVRLTNVEGTSSQAPGIARPPFSDLYLYADPDESLLAADTRRCTNLPSWSTASYAIEFRNNRHRVDDPQGHDLVSRDRIDPWRRLMEIFGDWSAAIGQAARDRPSDGIYIMLTGRASENGAVGHNLDLSRERADAVASALRQYWSDHGIAPHQIISVGRGEFDRETGASEALERPGQARRVDAAVCVRAESAAASP